MSQLTEYLNGAVEQLVKQALKASFKNPLESAFFLKLMPVQKSAAKKRLAAEAEGFHVPPFLIASIASQCNLFCKGCYARANHECGEHFHQEELSTEHWNRIFKEAAQMGITFILLAGGEPMLRRDVILAAARFPEIIFPIFTNGTLIVESDIELLNKRRNLIPMLSLEGNSAQTDKRRGAGVSDLLKRAMAQMNAHGIFYGVSITVTSQNLEMVTSPEFIDGLVKTGCKLALFVEYVPVDASTESLALGVDGREKLALRQNLLRTVFETMIFLSFPGDEELFGGCLAAGRGFFHINATGGAEPCPFSPFSDCSLKNSSLAEALQSPLFQKLKDGGFLQTEHSGGCALFGREHEIEKLLSEH